MHHNEVISILIFFYAIRLYDIPFLIHLIITLYLQRFKLKNTECNISSYILHKKYYLPAVYALNEDMEYVKLILRVFHYKGTSIYNCWQENVFQTALLILYLEYLYNNCFFRFQYGMLKYIKIFQLNLVKAGHLILFVAV